MKKLLWTLCLWIYAFSFGTEIFAQSNTEITVQPNTQIVEQPNIMRLDGNEPRIESQHDLILRMDYDNNNNALFLIKNGLNQNVFNLNEVGDLFIKETTTQGNLTVLDTFFLGGQTVSSPENFDVILDNNNSTIFGPSFIVRRFNGDQLFKIGGFGDALIASNTTIDGDLAVNGTISKSGGTFRIDHPLDPENKYLYHSFIESPDMMNVYNGNAITDEEGIATIDMPTYFQALNANYRYQLTPIGQFAQPIVKEEMAENSFVIQTDKPHVKVSWQVTGIRQDKWAQENRVQVEVEKTEIR